MKRPAKAHVFVWPVVALAMLGLVSFLDIERNLIESAMGHGVMLVVVASSLIVGLLWIGVTLGRAFSRLDWSH